MPTKHVSKITFVVVIFIGIAKSYFKDSPSKKNLNEENFLYDIVIPLKITTKNVFLLAFWFFFYFFFSNRAQLIWLVGLKSYILFIGNFFHS